MSLDLSLGSNPQFQRTETVHSSNIDSNAVIEMISEVSDKGPAKVYEEVVKAK